MVVQTRLVQCVGVEADRDDGQIKSFGFGVTVVVVVVVVEAFAEGGE